VIDQRELLRLFRKYFAFREMEWPDQHSALDFAVTEVAEALDADLRLNPKSNWRRHSDKQADLGMEICQAIMMLVIAADAARINLDQAMADWMKAKGFVADPKMTGDYLLWAKATANSKHIHLWGRFQQGTPLEMVQSACGLEFDPKAQFHSILGLNPDGEPVCPSCLNYWHAISVPRRTFEESRVARIMQAIFGRPSQ
jgi:hypothetical protein